jgi:hypothetical protein
VEGLKQIGSMGSTRQKAESVVKTKWENGVAAQANPQHRGFTLAARLQILRGGTA